MSAGTANKNSVTEVVWPWKEGEATSSSQAVAGIRKAALLQGVIGGAIGTGVYLYLSPTVGYVAWGLSGFLALIGLLSPTGLYASIKSGLDGFGRVVGTVMAWLLLLPVYYLFFTPFRLLFRGGKKDAMTRWLDPDAQSYWVTRDGEIKKESYERQF